MRTLISKFYLFIPTIIVMACFFCSAAQEPHIRPGVAPEALPYVVNFRTLIKTYVGEDVIMPQIDLDIQPISQTPSEKLLSKDGVTIGRCQPRFDGLPYQVIIDRDYFDRADPYDREAVIYHELGHCILLLKHDDTLDANKDPISLMHTFLPDGKVYKKHRLKYIQGLFKGVKRESIEVRWNFFSKGKK